MSKLLFAVAMLMSVAAPAMASFEAPAGSMESYGDAGRERHRVACYARNRRGFSFEAVAFDRREAEERVLRRCREVSRECFITGCREVEFFDAQ